MEKKIIFWVVSLSLVAIALAILLPGGRKVDSDLSSEDQLAAADLPIELINYIPAANLDESLILSRFGEPSERISEPDSGVTHWIYPDRGLSIGVNPEGKELIQYMPLERVPTFVEHISRDRVNSGS
ncbi:MAG: hypothetical protein AB2531_16580 [Candidatus Thiodiazotropha sp.]